MIVIQNIDDEKFSVDGVQQFKNFMSEVNYNNIRIVNAYDSKFVIVPWTKYDQIQVNGNNFANVEFLQEALLPVIYSRNTIAGNDLLKITISGLSFELKKNVPLGNQNTSTCEIGDVLWGFLADGTYVGMRYLGGDITQFENENIYSIFTGI